MFCLLGLLSKFFVGGLISTSFLARLDLSVLWPRSKFAFNFIRLFIAKFALNLLLWDLSSMAKYSLKRVYMNNEIVNYYKSDVLSKGSTTLSRAAIYAKSFGFRGFHSSAPILGFRFLGSPHLVRIFYALDWTDSIKVPVCDQRFKKYYHPIKFNPLLYKNPQFTLSSSLVLQGTHSCRRRLEVFNHMFFKDKSSFVLITKDFTLLLRVIDIESLPLPLRRLIRRYGIEYLRELKKQENMKNGEAMRELQGEIDVEIPLIDSDFPQNDFNSSEKTLLAMHRIAARLAQKRFTPTELEDLQATCLKAAAQIPFDNHSISEVASMGRGLIPVLWPKSTLGGSFSETLSALERQALDELEPQNSFLAKERLRQLIKSHNDDIRGAIDFTRTVSRNNLYASTYKRAPASLDFPCAQGDFHWLNKLVECKYAFPTKVVFKARGLMFSKTYVPSWDDWAGQYANAIHKVLKTKASTMNNSIINYTEQDMVLFMNHSRNVQLSKKDVLLLSGERNAIWAMKRAISKQTGISTPDISVKPVAISGDLFVLRCVIRGRMVPILVAINQNKSELPSNYGNLADNLEHFLRKGFDK